jgi:hypothetical protein
LRFSERRQLVIILLEKGGLPVTDKVEGSHC